MALAATGEAIGKVTQLLRSRLMTATTLDVTAGRIEAANSSHSTDRLNLFLYEIAFDPVMKNISLNEGQPSPIWLVLKYLLTAFDTSGNSDSLDAHALLGRGISALQSSNFLLLRNPEDDNIVGALEDNPEPLKISFDESPADLLARVMQGSDEKYRLSAAFQVRPVMIVPSEAPSWSLLVGVDYTTPEPKIIGEAGIKIPVIPSLAPRIDSIEPARFDFNEPLILTGSDLNQPGCSVMLDNTELQVTAQTATWIECRVGMNLVISGAISAGSHTVAVVQSLTGLRRRSSNFLVGELRPQLHEARVLIVRPVPSSDDRPKPLVTAQLVLSGVLIGTEADDILVGLYKSDGDGRCIKVLDEKLTFSDEENPPEPPPDPPLACVWLDMQERDAIPQGKYRIILKVNGQQAKNSPEVNLTL